MPSFDNSTLLGRIMRGAASYWRANRWIRWAAYGVVVGSVIGWFVGGIGIAARGTAFGLPGTALFAIVVGLAGGYLGKR